MKKLTNYNKKTIMNLSNIYGGGWVSSGSFSSTNELGCTVTRSDEYNDVNGDGKYDKSEVKIWCETIVC